MSKTMNTKMKLTAAGALALVLSACGGGGGGDSTTPATSTNPTDPVSGTAASGTKTASVTGVVYADKVNGAMVTAYELQANGTNGAVLGTSALTSTDGRFTMTLSAAPTGMVRFVASGGSFVSEADRSTQQIATLELVAPYVTTTLNNFVITPVTHIASRSIAYQAQAGTNLLTAYNNAWSSALSLSGTNLPLKSDSRRSVNLLSTVPNTASDMGTAYQDLITGLEWFGVKYDLPSKVVFRVAGSAGEAGFGANGVNGSGGAINVGSWSGSSFDENQVRTLDQVMELPKAQPTDPTLHDNIKTVMSVYIIRDRYLDAACRDVSRRADVVSRYPDLDGFFGSPAESGGCTGAADRIAALQAKIATNKRSAM